MSTRLRRVLVVVPLAVCFAQAAGAAERPARPDARAMHAPGAARPVGPTALAGSAAATRATAILGAAWTADNAPIKQAHLRLRDVVSGRVEATALANDAGQFAFENVRGGSYVVELVSATGRVEVVGHVFTIAPGETVATFVRTGTKVPWFNGFFNNSVAAVASSAASQGVTAIAPVARAVSPNR